MGGGKKKTAVKLMKTIQLPENATGMVLECAWNATKTRTENGNNVIGNA